VARPVELDSSGVLSGRYEHLNDEMVQTEGHEVRVTPDQSMFLAPRFAARPRRVLSIRGEPSAEAIFAFLAEQIHHAAVGERERGELEMPGSDRTTRR